ncbi:MAG: copper chaperone CopZ [Planctomycetota bacterium]
MQGALEAIPGVDFVDVDFENQTAKVTASSAVNADMLVSALAEADYSASVK